MKPSIAITLIICGTVVAAMPIIAHRLGLQLADVGSLCYLALAALMVVSAITGSFVTATRAHVPRGFDPLPAVSAT